MSSKPKQANKPTSKAEPVVVHVDVEGDPIADLAAEMENSEPVVKEPVAPVRYLVSAESEEYAGKTFGVQFNGGRAIIDKAVIPERLGRSVEDIVAGFQELPGYSVIPLE